MNQVFRRRTLVGLAVGAAVSFTAFLALSVFQEELSVVRSSGNDSFSVSAIGHRAWIEVLDELGVRLVVRRENRARPHPEALVVAAEPDTDADGKRRLRRVLEHAGKSLVVLPKWTGVENQLVRREVSVVTPVLETSIDGILEMLEIQGKLVRLGRQQPAMQWSGQGIEGIPRTPFMQLLDGGLDPVIECDQGILVGTVPSDPATWVLTDPDVIANHGLRRGDNARIAATIVDLARGDGIVILDETIHGFGIERSIWRDLFRFPLAYVLIHALIALGVGLWSGMIRFGSPRPVETKLAAGTTTLVDNTASLLLYGGRSRMLLGRYLERAIDDVALAHGSPAGATQHERRELVGSVAVRRGTHVELESITAEVRECVRQTTPQTGRSADLRALQVARRIHGWRGEILDGHPTGGRARRGDS